MAAPVRCTSGFERHLTGLRPGMANPGYDVGAKRPDASNSARADVPRTPHAAAAFLINREDRCCGRTAGFAPQIVTPAGGRNVAWLLAPVPLDGQGTTVCHFWPSIDVLAAPCQFRLPVQACIRSMYAPRLSDLARLAMCKTAQCAVSVLATLGPRQNMPKRCRAVCP